jgi:hypothetical protein
MSKSLIFLLLIVLLELEKSVTANVPSLQNYVTIATKKCYRLI